MFPAFFKEKEEQIIILQKGDERLFSSLNILAERYFEPQARFPLIAGKDRIYYEHILFETGSVLFYHMGRCKTDPSEISFSKILIRRVLSISEWGLNPNRPMNHET